jgi:hypothetical protein
LPEVNATQTAQPEWKYPGRAKLPSPVHGSGQQNSGSIGFLTRQMGDAQFEGYLVDELDSQRMESVDLCCTVVE